jgi:NADPH-dependent ferric siderophore reductase
MSCTLRPAFRFAARPRYPTPSRSPTVYQQFVRSQHTPTNIHNAPVKAKRSSLRGIAASLAFFATGWALNSHYKFISFSSPQPLNNSTFTPFTLKNKETVSSTSSIFTLSQSHIPNGSFDEWWKKGVWSIEIKQPQLQIARAYTPLPPLDGSDPDALRLLVRREKRGEVSGYLHRRPQGADVEIRGPAVEYELPEQVDHVVFLAGGTGVAPAIQIAHALGDKARIAVLWANRAREDCQGGQSDDPITPGWYATFSSFFANTPHHKQVSTGEKSLIVKQLDALKQTNKALTVDYFVDEESTFIKPQNVRNAVAQPSAQALVPGQGKRIILVSGPEGFINYWAGPKQWLNGREVQGPLGGALAHMDLKGWQVVKL